MGKFREPQTWQRIEELLDAALELPPTQRGVFLDSLNDADALFRPRLEELLLSSPEADALFEKPLVKRADDDIEPDHQIGPYRIVRTLGRGGMGEVYEAHRNDDTFQMQVAIKLLRSGKDSRHLIQRFHIERQILADLVHPNIARLHDGGTTPGGRPYLVMELIEGEQIDAYCDTHHLSIHQRLELFRQVCNAVSFAHRHSIVHRDIKPNNILVDTHGQSKLLDFGIAKILDGSQPAEESQPRTPQYASPEQFHGGPVTTSTDVFSLGVVLYELITGHPFRDHVGLGVPEDSSEPPSLVVQKTVEARSKVITPESVSEPRGIAPHRLPSVLSGDLDSIVLRALGRQPEERYPTVEHLAADIDRHLQGLPIEARQDEPLYRLRRLASYYRRQLSVAALCVLLLALCCLGLYSNLRAAERQQRTMAMTEFALDIFQQKEPRAGTAQDLTVQQLLAESVRDLEPSAEQSPLLGLIGSFYVGLGDYEMAALILRRSLSVVDREHPLWVYFKTDLNLVENIMHSKTSDAGSPALHPTISPKDSVDELPPPQGEHYVQFLSNRAVGLYQDGKFEASIQPYEEALALARDLQLPSDNIEIIQQNLATSRERLGQQDAARELLEDVLASRRQRFEEHPLEVVNSLRMLSILEQSSINPKGLQRAEALAREAVDKETLVNGWPTTMSLTTLATAKRLPLLLGPKSQTERQVIIDGARKLYENALEMEQQSGSSELRGIAAIELGLAVLSLEESDFTDAEARARRSRDIYLTHYDRGHWRIAEAESILGGALLGLGDLKGATPLLEGSLNVLRRTRGDAARPTIEAARRLDALHAMTE